MKNVEHRRRFSGRRPLMQTGDTLVEVLIATVIISVILSGAYITSRAGLLGVRQSEERGEGLKIAESQTEKLRAHGDYTSLPNNNFCFAPGATATTQDNSAALPATASADTFLGDYATACTVDSNGTLFTPTTLGIPYHIGIVYDNSTTVYDVHVRWDRVGGGGVDEVTLLYRLPSSSSSSSSINPNGGLNNNDNGSGDGNPTEHATKHYYNDATQGYPTGGYKGTEPTSCTYDWHDGSPPQTVFGNQCRSYTSSSAALAAGGFTSHDYCLPPGGSGPGGVPCNQRPPCMRATVGKIYPIHNIFTVTLTIPNFPGTITAFTNSLPVCQ